jgi:hypothetical protein
MPCKCIHIAITCTIPVPIAIPIPAISWRQRIRRRGAQLRLPVRELAVPVRQRREDQHVLRVPNVLVVVLVLPGRERTHGAQSVE